jgi:hypothetical protein
MSCIIAYPQTNLGSASITLAATSWTLYETAVCLRAGLKPIPFLITAIAGFCFSCLTKAYLDQPEKNVFVDFNDDNLANDFEYRSVSERSKLSSIISLVMGFVPTVLARLNYPLTQIIFGAEIAGFRSGYMLGHAFFHARYMNNNII